jgi:hypothetical protein
MSPIALNQVRHLEAIVRSDLEKGLKRLVERGYIEDWKVFVSVRPTLDSNDQVMDVRIRTHPYSLLSEPPATWIERWWSFVTNNLYEYSRVADYVINEVEIRTICKGRYRIAEAV